MSHNRHASQTQSDSPRGPLRMVVAAMLLFALAACATPFKADVSRFQSQLPAPEGQSFVIVPENPANKDSLEFRTYAELVSEQMRSQGYSQASTTDQATLVVKFGYGVDNGRERIRSTGFARDPFFSPWYGYNRFGYRSFYSPWSYGWQDPWFDNGIDVYTVYTSGINVKINRRIDDYPLFEGQAEAVSTSNSLPYLVPNLVEAMFTKFPGNSGETVRISVAPEKNKR